MGDLSDSEIIRRQMMAGPSNLASVSANEKTKELNLEKNAHHQEELFQSGYSLVSQWVEENLVEGMYSSKEDPSLTPVKGKDFKIDLEGIRIREGFWKNYMKAPHPLQDMFRYTDDMVIHIYSIGNHYFEEKEYVKAISIFEFVCMLDTDISLFWIAKGVAYEGNNEIMEAMNIYEKCTAKFPLTFDPYIGLIRCSEKMKDFTKVKEMLQSIKENPQLKEQTEGALEYISSVAA